MRSPKRGRESFSMTPKKTTPVRFLIPLSAATIAGVALWLSRASFDVAGTTAVPIRVAMLPSFAELVGLVVMALLLAAGIASVLHRRRDESFWEPAADVLLPLFALLLLVLPYLPWIADWIPAVRLLAGPGRFVIWVVAIGQVLWLVLPQLSESRAAAAFGIGAVVVSAPFVLNVDHFGAAFVDIYHTVRRLPSADWSLLPTGILG